MPRLLLAALVFLGGISAGAQIGDSFGYSPYWDWKTIETEHFRLTYPSELEATAQKAARYCEQAFTLHSARLYWDGFYKTQVVLVDNTDAANGATVPLARTGIVLQVTPPEPFFSTTYYDDWLRLLIFHEYTHELNMDATTGIWTGLRYVFGETYLPNAAWSRWMAEGLAVYFETRLTHSGRGRSPFYEMMIRTAVSEGRFGARDYIGIDRIDGEIPYYPGGETAYMYGYELMNEVAQFPMGSETADQLSEVKRPDDALGLMSIRSAGRLPFFINGNLENITGRNWYDFWASWTAKSRSRAMDQLQTIRSQPVTEPEYLTEKGYETLGSAVSPDGKWIAYTQESYDEREGLYLRELATGKTRKLADKLYGSNLSFTADGGALVYSSMGRRDKYYFLSDLWVYDLSTDADYPLTHSLRARDPSISRDGSAVVFTVTENQSVHLATAKLSRGSDGRYELGSPERLLTVGPLDRAASPRFTADGKIVFSLHRNGHFSEELEELDPATRKTTTLVADGHFNRFPAVHPDGSVYFVSDRSGVDNLYRLSRGAPEQMTNLVSGIWFPAFAPNGDAYGAVFRSTGWDLARFKTGAAQLRPIAAPPAPQTAAESDQVFPDPVVRAGDYSVWPSILPRQWAPILFFDRVYFGGEISGNDTIERHSYDVVGTYDSLLNKAEWLVNYQNRSLGPVLSLAAANVTDAFDSIVADNRRVVLSHGRKLSFNASAQYSFDWTYSTLRFILGAGTEHITQFAGAGSQAISIGDYVTSIQASSDFTNVESSRLAIAPEGGRSSRLSAVSYLLSSDTNLKMLFSDTEYAELPGHSVLVPQAKVLWASHQPDYSSARSRVRGRAGTLRDFSGNTTDLTLRGYQGQTYESRISSVLSLDYLYPIARVYHGAGTNPFFLTHLTGGAFVESAYFPLSDGPARALPSVGASLTMGLEIFYLPMDLALGFHYGFRRDLGGGPDFVGELGFFAVNF